MIKYRSDEERSQTYNAFINLAPRARVSSTEGGSIGNKT